MGLLGLLRFEGTLIEEKNVAKNSFTLNRYEDDRSFPFRSQLLEKCHAKWRCKNRKSCNVSRMGNWLQAKFVTTEWEVQWQMLLEKIILDSIKFGIFHTFLRNTQSHLNHVFQCDHGKIGICTYGFKYKGNCNQMLKILFYVIQVFWKIICPMTLGMAVSGNSTNIFTPC